MRKLILFIAVAIAVAIGFSLSTLRATVSRGAEAMAEAVADGMSGEVSVGDVSLTLFPYPIAEINEVSVVSAGHRGEKGEPILYIPRVRVHPKFFPLLVGSVVVDSVEAVDAVLHVRRPLGKSTFETFLPDDAAAELTALRFPIAFTDSSLHYFDGGRPQPLKVDVVDLDLDVVVSGRRDESTIDIVGTGRPFGDASLMTFSLEIEPGAGSGSAYRVEGPIEISRAEADAIQALFPLFEELPLAGQLDAELAVSGVVGDVTTEAAPATPLEIAAQGSIDFEMFGKTDELSFDAVFVVDDRSVQVKKGDLQYVGLAARAGGWMTGIGRKLSGRLHIDELDIGEAMGTYGIDSMWHPELVVSGSIKLSGHELEPLLNYEASAESTRFAPYPGYEVASDAMTFRGSLLASNAVFSISTSTDELRIGSLELVDPAIGSRWFRDKLTITALDLAVWDGKSNSAITYEPKENEGITIGGMVDGAEANVFVEDLFPELGLEITGGMDGIAQGGFDAQRPWSLGRVGFYDGEVGSVGIVHAILTTVARDAGVGALIDADLVAAYPRTLAPEMPGYERIEMDYQTRDDGLALRSIDIVLAHAEIKAEGLIESDHTFAGWGVAALSLQLTDELVRRVPRLMGLCGSDGRFRIPVKLRGGPSATEITVDERFVEAVRNADRGENVSTFVATESRSELVLDMPTLREQFNRW
jgi:hypothetical protein